MTENQELMHETESLESTEDASEMMPSPEATQEESPEEAVPAEETVDYKEEMRRLKAAYKAKKKEEKRRLAEEPVQESSGDHTVRTIILSVVATLLVLSVTMGIVAFYPSYDQSLLAQIVRKYVVAVTPQDPYPDQEDVTVGGESVSPGDQVTITVDGEISASAVYAKASKSVVGIEVRYFANPWDELTKSTIVSQGSGVIYSEDGQIITNHHVIETAINTKTGALSSNYKVLVYFNTDLTEYYEVTSLIGYDAENDIAMIKVDAKGLHPIEFADADTLEVGEPVAAIGCPGGLEFMNSISEGIISGLDRDITSSSAQVTVYELIQTTAAINPGNSGGALLNQEGKLIGICVIKIVDESFEGMGFAINSNTVSRIVDSFLKYGRYVKPVLGVRVNTEYTAKVADSKGWPLGAYVYSVDAGSAAKEAGIQENDIICEVQGEKITKFAALRKILLRNGVETPVSMKIFRTKTGEYLNITVTLHAS